MNCRLKYGRNDLMVEFPPTIQPAVFRTADMPLLDEPIAHIEEALLQPRCAAPLAELARGKHDVCIVVSDATRPAPNSLLLPPIIDILSRNGIPSEAIRILVATGIHRPPTTDELRDILGEDISSRFAVVSHNARDTSAIKRLGFTESGIPMDINKLYLESDLKIVIGLVEPHFMAGFSGGRKSIAIGLTSVDAIRHLHGPQVLEAAYTRNCSLKNNVLHRELMKIATAASVDVSVNVVMNAERRIGGFFVGDLTGSHTQACAFANRYVAQPRAGLFDIVVTTSAGHPLDTTYYQAVKGLVGALDILKPGGSIILAAECRNGLGSSEFVSMLELLYEIGDYDLFIKHISDSKNFCIDQWEVEMLVKVLRKAKIYLYSEKLAEQNYPLAQARKISSVEAGLELALAGAGPHAQVAVVPEGPYFVPIAGEGEAL